MTDISVRTKAVYANEDQRWIGNGGEPIGKPRSIVLDRSAFDFDVAYPNDYIPSGIPLGKITTSGLYGPYTGGQTDEVQTITEGGSGLTSFTLTYSGQTTGSLDDQATAAQVQAALEALSNIAVGDVTVTGSAGGPYTVTFGGSLANTNVAAMTATPTGGTGTVTIATATAGGADDSADGRETGVGYLFATVAVDPDSTGDIAAALFWSGEVVTNYLPPVPAAQTDSAFRTDVASHIAFVTNTV